MSFPATPPVTGTLHTEDERRFAVDSSSRWRATPFLNHRYFTVSNADSIGQNIFPQSPFPPVLGKVRLLASLNPSADTQLQINVDRRDTAWLNPTDRGDWNQGCGILDQGSAKWRRNDWLSGNAPNQYGIFLTWANDWKMGGKYEQFLEITIHGAGANWSFMHWHLTLRRSAGAYCQTLGTVAFRCPLHMLRGFKIVAASGHWQKAGLAMEYF